MNGKEYAQMLRAHADWWEAHPTLPAPYWWPQNVFLDSKEELAAVARGLEKAEKGSSGEWYYLRVTTPDGTQLDFNVSREKTCVRRVIGTEEVPEKVTPAYTREIVEWDCQPLLGGASDV